MKTYCAVRFISGVVHVQEWEAAFIAGAITSKRVFGIIRDIQAASEFDAETEAKKIFAGDDYELSLMGQSICDQLLKKMGAKGGAR